MSFLENSDKQVFDIINKELVRQTEHLEMIASENFTFTGVMEAGGKRIYEQICRRLSV